MTHTQRRFYAIFTLVAGIIVVVATGGHAGFAHLISGFIRVWRL